MLRGFILEAVPGLEENIKWNGPNYSFDGEDRITMKINPPIQVQLIFHRGAKVKALPAKNLIDDDAGLLAWKTTDRAVASFNNAAEIIEQKEHLQKLIKMWIGA